MELNYSSVALSGPLCLLYQFVWELVKDVEEVVGSACKGFALNLLRTNPTAR